METATRIGAVTHPCQKGTRYRRYAFSAKDYGKYMEIKTVGTKRIIKIDGFVRTVVQGPVYQYWNPSVVWPDGSYEMSDTAGTDKIGGNVNMYLPSAGGNTDASFNGNYGNPTIQFDSSIGANPNVVITLSTSVAAASDNKYFSTESVKMQEIVLTQDLTASVCASLKETGNPVNPVFALFNGAYWIHDPRFELINNTLTAPAPDGGGKLSRDTFNIVQPDQGAICSNAPRTFLNEDTCFMTENPKACVAELFDPYDYSNLPKFYVTVNPTTIRNIYSATGGGADDPNPLMRDIWNWWDVECPAPVYQSYGFEVKDLDGTKCWKNVHPDHLDVYDMTFWTRLDGHPGNSASRNPIKEFAQRGATTLDFPSWHSMNRWSDNKYNFGFVGRLGDKVHYYSLPKELRSPTLNQLFGFTPSALNFPNTKGVLVCGSPFEVANDLMLGGSQGRGAYDSANPDYATTDFVDFAKQKRIVWTQIALGARDQLRQRVAWALAQILVVSPTAVSDAELMTDAMTTYYDIFVRNAFGNYRSILKEVSYSPLMAQMLTYYGSRSTAYTWRNNRELEFADENYAREIMQLFTIGMHKLNKDGTKVLESSGNPVRAYTNDDIVEYARVWTGFVARSLRGNIENLYDTNNVDPMRINLEYRDVFPKMGLDRKYIGDGVPLCSDLPARHFLRRGATYRLLGRSPSPSLQSDPEEWLTDKLAKRLKLQPNGVSSLFYKLCGTLSASTCTNKPLIVLDANLGCSRTECSVDTVRVVEYWGERTTYATAGKRSVNQLCNRWPRPECDPQTDPTVGTACASNEHFWTTTRCTLRAKISPAGTVGIVHSPYDIEPEAISGHVQNNTQTFFRVDWSSDTAPDFITSNCDSISGCDYAIDGVCVCDITVSESQVFFNGGEPTRTQVLTSLPIGAFDPKLNYTTWKSKTINGVIIYTTNGNLASSSVFEVTDGNGIRQFRKNVKSTVKIVGSAFSFRNPVHFISLSDPELYQAQYETDAALDHYFYHPNTAPFLAVRFAQRFGISNPSPGYITRIGNAFRSGLYTFTSGVSPVTYGSRRYGDLGAMVACVLLDREARTTLLDADPTHGSLKEPLIKVVGLMRALEFTLASNVGFVDFDIDINKRIGQMAYAFPNVFSFFLPEHKAPGPVGLASLVAPEAQVITGPRTIDFLNGVFSLIKYGLTPCLEGFGRYQWWDDMPCWEYTLGGNNKGVFGKLSYLPASSSSVATYIDELAMLLTAGRLSTSNRNLIRTVVAAEPNRTMAVMKAQQLIALAPEFHSTNIARKSGVTRPEPESPTPSTKPYKAVVYLLLDGGMDSFNMLVPHTCDVTNGDGKTVLEQYYDERTSLAMNDDERTRIIDATDQPCSQFAVHRELEVVERLYNEGDLAFFANAGVLNRPVDKDNYYERTKTSLFGHDTMQAEAQKVDPFDGAPGTGILGRMCDVLKRLTYTPQPITVQDATIATVGVPGASVDPLTVSPYETNDFNPTTEGETFDPVPHLKRLNDATTLQSSLYGNVVSTPTESSVR
ncbi:Protein of unknown function (DUF1501) [Fragilaria crotonensis]|nr:Protein of unknown function (DUF1501) [Fragilaria crotonensis]